MSEPIILFIVEGEKRDYRFIDEMVRCFMVGRHRVSVIEVPAAQNIYMLYQRMVEDDFESDIVELLRESVPDARSKLEGVSRRYISQVYLFFDFDLHQDNFGDDNVNPLDVVRKMLEVFDNETENGKLYISYPMVESLYDYVKGSCQAYTKCHIPLGTAGSYKRLSGSDNPNSSLHVGHEQWKEIIEVYGLRVKCLLELERMDFDSYRLRVNPLSLFEAQRSLCESMGRVFVLSAFPEFLLDYFKCDFWNSHVRRTKYSFSDCEKGR